MSAADELLAHATETYARCRSYRDMGEVASVTITGSKSWQRHTSRRPFQTAFVRPDRFLFEFKDMTLGPESEWTHHAVWSNARGIGSWSTLVDAGPASHASLAEALAGPTGVSGGSAWSVPSRLLGLHDGADDRERGYDLEGSDDVDGRPCARLQGRRFGQVDVLWIDRERHLIVRRFERLRFTPELLQRRREALLARPDLPDELRAALESEPLPPEREFTTETTTFYRPELDVAIDPRVFDVRVPG